MGKKPLTSEKCGDWQADPAEKDLKKRGGGGLPVPYLRAV
jgi:hypothetical protein